jgi:hypothetical protein
MASLEFDRVSEQFRVRFRFEECEYKRSLKTGDRKVARRLMGRIEYTLQLIERDEFAVPQIAEALVRLLSATGSVHRRVLNGPAVQVIEHRF